MESQLMVVIGIGVGVLQGLGLYILSGMSKKIDTVCKNNREDHRQIFDQVSSCEHRITVVEGRMENN